MMQLPIGARAPDFELEDTQGQSHRLSDALMRGPVVLAFYKSACPTCQFTFPHIQRLVTEVGTKAPWTLWGISEDDVEGTRSFAERSGISFPLLIDEYPYKVSAAYGLEFVPAILIIQPDGTISLSDFGFTKASLNEIAGFEFFPPNDGIRASLPG
jgi:peroxiredoxin